MACIIEEDLKVREAANATLLNYGFTFYETKLLYPSNQAMASAKVWKAEENPVKVGITADGKIRRHCHQWLSGV